MTSSSGGVDAVRKERRAAAAAATALGRDDLAYDVALVVSELVTNALLHGGGCTGVAVSAVADGLRVEVRDRSRVPPVIAHPSEGSLTGRGVQLVASLAARWGVDPRPGGKVVWAELTGEVHAAFDAATPEEVLASWAEGTAGPEPLFHVEIGDVPTDLLLAAKSHVDNIVRELSLAASGAMAGTTAEVPPRLASLLRDIDAFAHARRAIKHQAIDAANAKADRTKLSLDLPASAAPAASAYLAALDDIDAYSRARRLLTLETPPQHRAFRRWYVDELVAQLRALAIGVEPRPPQSFERRLLVEIDRAAAAQRVSDRAARLYTVAAALATAATPEEVADAVLDEGVAALGASGGGVMLATETDQLAVPGVVGYEPTVVAKLRAESLHAELPAAVAMRTREAVWIESRDERDERFPELVGLEATTIALCAVPLMVGDRLLGALRFSFPEPRLFDDDERRFVLTLAAQTAQALERAQLQQTLVDVSRRLQRSLLPPSVPVIPGIDIAALYRPFGDGMDVGGDFYDIWEVGPKMWAIAIGDAAGTGPEAASMTALVRHTLRALTLSRSDGSTTHDPAAVMKALNAVLADSLPTGSERFCTALLVLVDVAAGVTLTIANAGHPDPVIRRADGSIDELEVRGTMLGAFPDADMGCVTTTLGPGDRLLLVTDGVLEARNAHGFFGSEGVARVLTMSTGSAAAVVADLDGAVVDHIGGSLSDDMAAVVIIAGS